MDVNLHPFPPVASIRAARSPSRSAPRSIPRCGRWPRASASPVTSIGSEPVRDTVHRFGGRCQVLSLTPHRRPVAPLTPREEPVMQMDERVMPGLEPRSSRRGRPRGRHGLRVERRRGGLRRRRAAVPGRPPAGGFPVDGTDAGYGSSAHSPAVTRQPRPSSAMALRGCTRSSCRASPAVTPRSGRASASRTRAPTCCRSRHGRRRTAITG